jgi:hypothetical protein
VAYICYAAVPYREARGGGSSKIISAEEKRTGAVLWLVYKQYAKYAGFMLVVAMVTFALAETGGGHSSEWY